MDLLVLAVFQLFSRVALNQLVIESGAKDTAERKERVVTGFGAWPVDALHQFAQLGRCNGGERACRQLSTPA